MSKRPYNNPFPLKRFNKKIEDEKILKMKEVSQKLKSLAKKHVGIAHSEETHKKVLSIALDIQDAVSQLVWSSWYK